MIFFPGENAQEPSTCIETWQCPMFHEFLSFFCWSGPGLPDGLFSNKRSKFGYILEGLRLENVDMMYGCLEYFMDIWNI
jgi:hypothetical protein